MFAIVEAIKKGYSIEKIARLSKVTPWFLYKIRNIVEIEKTIKEDIVSDDSSQSFKRSETKRFFRSTNCIIYKE